MFCFLPCLQAWFYLWNKQLGCWASTKGKEWRELAFVSSGSFLTLHMSIWHSFGYHSCREHILILLYIFFRQHPVVHYIVSFELKSSVIILLYNWEFFRMKQRLENPSFKPTKDHILAALDNFVDILKIRYSSPLFRLTTASDIEVHEFFAPTS